MVIAVAAEPEDFIDYSTTLRTTTSITYFDSTLSRVGIDSVTNGTARTRQFTNQTDVWIGFFVYVNDVQQGKILFGVRDADLGNSIVSFQTDSTADNKFQLYLNGSVVANSPYLTFNEFTKYRLDLHVVYATNGLVEVFRDKHKVFSWKGDTTIAGVSGIDQFEFQRPVSFLDNWFSQIVVDTVSTVSTNLSTNNPTADGFYTQFLGTFADIDEIVPDGNVIQSGTAGEKFTYIPKDIDASHASKSIRAVAQTGLFNIPANATINDFRFIVRNGGTDAFSANLGITKDGTEQYKQVIYINNPVDNQPFDQADINSGEFGLESV